MRTDKKIGIILILTGICLLLLSAVFLGYRDEDKYEGEMKGFYYEYIKKIGLVGDIKELDVVIKKGKWLGAQPGYIPAPAPLPSPTSPELEREYERLYRDPWKNFTPHYEGRIAIPLKYFFAADIIIIFVGIGIIIFSKSNKEEAK